MNFFKAILAIITLTFATSALAEEIAPMELYLSGDAAYVVDEDGYIDLTVWQHESEQELRTLISIRRAEQQSLHAEEIDLLARALYGEYREGDELKRQIEWSRKVSAIYNRMTSTTHTNWPGDLISILLYRCEINALCDDVPEDLSTEIGQEAVQFATEFVNALHYGPYEPLDNAHSWATPEAAIDNPYFQGKCLSFQGPGHGYYADCDA